MISSFFKKPLEKTLTRVLKMSSGPWGPWNDSGQKTEKPKNPNFENPKPRQQNSEDAAKKFDDFLDKIFGGGSNNSGGQGGFGGGNNQNKFANFGRKKPKSLIGLIILGLIFLWLISGLFKIDPDENGVVMYFGKFSSVATPGLNYHIPYPFGKVITESVTNVNTEEFGFRSGSDGKSSGLDAESLMLTGDENIVDIEFQVQWQINDIKDYAFNIVEQRQTIRKVAESAMREVIARTPIVDALSDGKKNIELEVKVLLQKTLDSYNSGVGVVLVQLLRVDPPMQVIDAFRDVQTAKADKEKEINEAQSYSNDIIPRARGSAAEMIQEAQAYKESVIADAEGQASRFVAVHNQYRSAPTVTKRRIYLETMEKIYRDNEKIIIDNKLSSSGLLPYFPLNDLRKPANMTPITQTN